LSLKIKLISCYPFYQLPAKRKITKNRCLAFHTDISGLIVDAGYRMLECWMVDTGWWCWILDGGAGYWMLGAGCWMLFLTICFLFDR